MPPEYLSGHLNNACVPGGAVLMWTGRPHVDGPLIRTPGGVMLAPAAGSGAGRETAAPVSHTQMRNEGVFTGLMPVLPQPGSKVKRRLVDVLVATVAMSLAR